MAVSGMGMSMSGLLGFLCCRVFGFVEAKAVIPFAFWRDKVLPVGLFMALTLWTGNQVYLYLTVAFIQVSQPSRQQGACAAAPPTGWGRVGRVPVEGARGGEVACVLL